MWLFYISKRTNCVILVHRCIVGYRSLEDCMSELISNNVKVNVHVCFCYNQSKLKWYTPEVNSIQRNRLHSPFYRALKMKTISLAKKIERFILSQLCRSYILQLFPRNGSLDHLDIGPATLHTHETCMNLWS